MKSMQTSAATSVPTKPIVTRVSGATLRLSVARALVGLFVFAVGAKPDWFGWDRSPVVGFVQIAVFLAGLGII